MSMTLSGLGAAPAVQSATSGQQQAVAAAAQALATGVQAGGDADGDNDGTPPAGPTGNGTTITVYA